MRAATIAVLLALAGQAHAEGGDRDPECDCRAELAERIMRHRQDSDDLESTWRMASLIRHVALSRFAQGLVQAAYGQPRRESDEERDQAAREFAAQAKASCLAGPDAAEADQR